MTAPLSFTPDIILLPFDGGVVASNCRARTHVWLNHASLSLLLGMVPQSDLGAVDLTVFSNRDGLLADPTGLLRDKSSPVMHFENPEALTAWLSARYIVCDDLERYWAYFGEKTSMLDHSHHGTFHQRLGIELRLKMRVDSDRWWYEQKFDPETNEIRPTLYKAIQEAFVESYFDRLSLEGKTVLDFGCGSGMAARRFLARGAKKVIGIDPDPVHLGEATRLSGPNFHPVAMDLKSEDPLACIPDEPIDLVWMSDVLMFYFHPLAGGTSSISPATVLERSSRSLRESGRLVIMQPHGVFWLAPWLGHSDKPYTVLSEYQNRTYSVAPSLSQLSEAINEANLVIHRIYEPGPTGDGGEERARRFASEFPLWWVFECGRDRI